MKTYNTNEICQLCDVSRKQLRYYEERGMLSAVPRYKDNNYRYYTHQHICEIVAAKALKNIDMSLSEIKDIIYGRNIGSIQMSIEKKMVAARDNLQDSLLRYEQSMIVYTKLIEAISVLKLHNHKIDTDLGYELADFPEQTIISLSYRTNFEDEDCYDIEYMAKIQTLSQEVNVASLGALLYVLYNHFDSKTCSFDHKVHSYKIAVPVIDTKKPCLHYDKIPAFRGVCAVHIGTPKDKRLLNTYTGLLCWAKSQGYELADWSVEEWLISPMITNNKDFWILRIIIPFKEYSRPEPGDFASELD